jgi:creatinine amidohydrolase
MKSILTFLCLLLPAFAQAQTGGSVAMEDLTWVEVRDRIAQGASTVIVPIGGTEQSGPHMATGKHTSIIRYAANDIARKLGNTLIAPVIAYNPSGRISPPEGNMQFPGTISLREETLAMVLEDVAGSLKQSGFRLICLLGDNSGSQRIQQLVADKLSTDWSAEGVRVLHVGSFAEAAPQLAWAEANGAMAPAPMAHAGMAETSQLMAVNPAQVRGNLLAAFSERDFATQGAAGDATQSNATFGRGILGVKIDAALRQIKQAMQ